MTQKRKRLSRRKRIAVVKKKQSPFSKCRDELARHPGFMFV
jgi:hypothetical protein